MRIVLALIIGTMMTLIGGAEGAVAGEAAHAKISDFFGSYVGQTDQDIVKGVPERDASVVIKPSGKSNFTVSWKTVIRRTSGKKPKITFTSITFFPTVKRAGIYASAMKRDIFGHMTPLNPLSGDPYVWASLRGKTLTVWSLDIIDGGGYEIGTYKRTLIDVGLQLRFERVRNGKTMKLITATLKKTDK